MNRGESMLSTPYELFDRLIKYLRFSSAEQRTENLSSLTATFLLASSECTEKKFGALDLYRLIDPSIYKTLQLFTIHPSLRRESSWFPTGRYIKLPFENYASLIHCASDQIKYSLLRSIGRVDR